MYIIIAIIAFGVLVGIHEFGHFITAKACDVQVNEFAIGMGPAIFKKQKGETLYSLRALPIGGYCAMEGEEGESENPRAFTSKSPVKKIIILLAGSFMNFLMGIVLILIIFMGATQFVGSTVTGFLDGFELEGEQGLMVGDTIYSIDGERVYYSNDFTTLMYRAGDSVDMVVVRDGRKITLEDLPLQQKEFVIDGETVMKYGLTFNLIEANFLSKLNYSVYTAYNFARSVRLSLSDLISGNVGMDALTGPVGIVDAANEMAQSAGSVSLGLKNLCYVFALVAICVAVTNLLPIPALDGGRIVCLLITLVVEKISGKKLDPKYEGWLNTVCFMLLMGLMIYVMFNDVMRIVHG